MSIDARRDAPITVCPGCGNSSGENYDGNGLCWECFTARTDPAVSNGSTPKAAKAGTYSPQEWAQAIRDGLQRDEDIAMPFPFDDLNRSMDGGLRFGEVCLVAGYTSMGKSVIVDQMADSAARAGRRVHLYMTEMTAYQRGLRLLARRTNLSFGSLRRRYLTPEIWQQINGELDALPYGCSVVADWTVEDVCAHILENRWDVAFVDLIHGFHYQDERDLSKTSSAMVRAAKASSTGDHPGTTIVAAAHLNDGQMQGQRSPKRPKPGLHSIKGASSLKQDADVVMFVHLEDNEDGIPTADGEVWAAKNRQGALGSCKVRLDIRRMAFRAVTSEDGEHGKAPF